MKIRPFNDRSEHEEINLFALDVATGARGLLVKVAGSGFQNTNAPVSCFDTVPSINNAYIPRWAVPHRVTACGSGQAAMGFLLYDVKEFGFEGRHLIHDPIRAAEAQAVASGQAVPIATKGLFLVGDLGSGVVPLPGKYAIPSNAGDGSWAVSATKTSVAFGKWLGALDTDGYALVKVDFDA